MDERSLPTSDCKLQAFYAMNVSMAGLLRAARNDKVAGFFTLPAIRKCVTARLKAVAVYGI